jgi:hypothetical protein
MEETEESKEQVSEEIQEKNEEPILEEEYETCGNLIHELQKEEA